MIIDEATARKREMERERERGHGGMTKYEKVIFNQCFNTGNKLCYGITTLKQNNLNRITLFIEFL